MPYPFVVMSSSTSVLCGLSDAVHSFVMLRKNLRSVTMSMICTISENRGEREGSWAATSVTLKERFDCQKFRSIIQS